MRTILLALAVTALVATPIHSADAASHYRVSASVSDRSLDLTSGDGSNRTTVIKGRVKGGSLKGKKVYLYASNTSARDQGYRYIGSDRLTSSGRFAKRWKPRDGGSYLVKVVKRAGSGRSAGSDTTRVNVYQFVNLARFYDNDPAKAAVVRRVDRAGVVGNDYWSTAYQIEPGATAVFNTQGYRCFQLNVKIGVANTSRSGSGSYAVTQGSHTIKAGRLSKGDRYVEPTSTERRRILAYRPVAVTASGASFVLGNPKALCTYPTRTTPPQ